MFIKIFGLAAVAGLLVLIQANLFAQTPRGSVPRELVFGIWVSGTLNEGDEQWFSIRPSQTGVVTVETSGETDTFLEAYDPAMVMIDSNDDGGEDYNAKLEIFAEAGKTYLFKLTCYDEDEGGPYQIRASFDNIRELYLGNWVPGNLSLNENHWFSIRTTGTGIVIVETSGDTDTYLKVFGVTGSAIAEDDDSGDGYNARLEFFAEAGRMYRIKLSDFDKEGGPYRIRAGFENLPPETERNTALSRAIPIRLGEAVQVLLRSPSESRWYRYDISRANTLFVIQTRGNLDTVLGLYNAQGDLIEEDDDSGDGANALISRNLDPGTVYVEVKEYGGGMGRCTLHAETR